MVSETNTLSIGKKSECCSKKFCPYMKSENRWAHLPRYEINVERQSKKLLETPEGLISEHSV